MVLAGAAMCRRRLAFLPLRLHLHDLCVEDWKGRKGIQRKGREKEREEREGDKSTTWTSCLQ